MLRRALFAFSATTALLSPAASGANILHPIQNWVVDYREDQCLATREYGSAESPITLAIRPAPTGETYELLVGREHAGPDFATEQKGYVDFGNGRVKSWLLNYGFKKTKADVYQFRISAAEMQQALHAQTVTLSPEHAPDFTFELKSMPALLTGLQSCTADLRQYWNMDGEKNGRIATSSKGDVRSLFSADDYPAEAIDRNQQGSIRLQLLVDERGLVAGCDVLEPSGIPLFDVMGCQVMEKRAKFTPALDKSGKPTRSTVTTPKIVWKMGVRNSR